MLINHRQSSTAFVCFLSGKNNIACGVHRPVLPSSIKIVRLVELTDKNLLIMLWVTASISGKCHEAIAQALVFYTIRAKEKKTEKKRGAGYPRLVQTMGYKILHLKHCSHQTFSKHLYNSL